MSEWKHDWVVAPGEMLQEVLDDRGISQAELARQTGHSTKMINQIVKAKAPIRPSTALEFERVLGVTAAFWVRLEGDYRLGLARKAVG